jgi:hypothetical protein
VPREDIPVDRPLLVLPTATETRSPLFVTVSTSRRPERGAAMEEPGPLGIGPAYI